MLCSYVAQDLENTSTHGLVLGSCNKYQLNKLAGDQECVSHVNSTACKVESISSEQKGTFWVSGPPCMLSPFCAQHFT